MFQKLILYFRETRLEMNRVNWPSRRNSFRFTAVVIAVSLGVAALLGAFDFLFRAIIGLVI